jgi:large subunit ribosomal protein L17
MKHRVVGRRLDRTTEHRTAMLRNMVTSLLRHERIATTTPKAKELKRFADKIITLGKRGTPHARRIAARDVRDVEVIEKLFGPIAERFAKRPGGYTRVVRTGRRTGDNADMSVIELVERAAAAEGDKGGKKVKEKAPAKAAAAPKSEKKGKKAKEAEG